MKAKSLLLCGPCSWAFVAPHKDRHPFAAAALMLGAPEACGRIGADVESGLLQVAPVLRFPICKPALLKNAVWVLDAVELSGLRCRAKMKMLQA